MTDATMTETNLPAWNGIPYLIQQYYHDDPKKLNDFRLPELDALTQLNQIPKCYKKSEVLYSSPFLRAYFPHEQAIKAMAARAILVQRWCELLGSGLTFEDCLKSAEQHRTEERIKKFTDDASLTYDIRIHTFGHTPTPEELQAQKDGILRTLQLRGQFQSGTSTVQTRFFLFADIGSLIINPSRIPRHYYLCREICDEKFNTLENDYRLNARTFIGPTSMPANLSFIMANLGQVTKNSIVYDPFVGTGSLLVSAGHFGATCIGSDLDWKILHGRTKKGPISVFDNFKQYGLKRPEIICSDLSCNIWKSANGTYGRGFIDAIVCDPPYGVRAGARKSGRAESKDARSNTPTTSSTPTTDPPTPTPTPASQIQSAHIPTTQIYDVEDVIHDLLDQAAQLLKIGGRLIYWLPTTTDFRNDELPPHPCLRQVSVAEQVVRSHFSRRLITMEKYLEFTPERRMHRRNKLTDPPPKYANLKETIQALVEEGPDRLAMDTTGQLAAAAASSSSSTDPVPFDPSSSFAPRPMSRSTLKKLAKLENLHARRQREAEENGGVRPSRKERMATRERLPQDVWRAQQKERNLKIHQERNQANQTATTSSTSHVSKKRDATEVIGTNEPTTSTSSSSTIATTDTMTDAAPTAASPPSPQITQPTKKARTDQES